MIKAIIFFLAAYLFSAVFIPAMFGFQEIWIMPLLLSSIIIFSPSTKAALIQVVVIGLLAEILSAANFGSYLVPALIVVPIYLWLSRLIDFGGNNQEVTLKHLISWSLILFAITYLYVIIYLVLRLDFSIQQIWRQGWYLTSSAVFIFNLPLAAVYVFIFKKYYK